MATVSASTADKMPVTVPVEIAGMPMDVMSAGKIARSIKSSLRYELGLGMGDDDDLLEVIVNASAPSSSPVDPESPEVVKATPEEIAAMTTAELKAAKAEGRL